MRRIAIIILYNPKGIIEDYVFFYLAKLQEICRKVVVVVNGQCQQVYIQRMQLLKYEIILRSNIGYDGGAYQDIFLKYRYKLKLDTYDEVVLSNDTFYGPFNKMSDMWNKFENINCDYWGITRHPGGIGADKQVYPEHIQAYFLVLKKRIITQDHFIGFWEKFQCPRSYWEAVRNFEIGINNYLREQRYIGKALMDLAEDKLPIKFNDNPYIVYSYELVVDMKFPFLKKKALDLRNVFFKKNWKCIEYLDKSQLYNVDLIKQDIKNTLFDIEAIQKFMKMYTRVYIYGKGIVGQNVDYLLKENKCHCDGFLTTYKVSEESDINSIDEVKMSDDMGVILAMNAEHTKEVIEVLRDKNIKDSQMFCIY